MSDKESKYYFIDINLTTSSMCNWVETPTATHTGETEDPVIHRIFLPKGQYNKLINKLEKQS